MDNYFVFNGQRSTDYGITIEHCPPIVMPARKIKLIDLPGRNGSHLSSEDAFENVVVSYDCYFRGSPEQASKIATWLYAPGPNYARLEDTYHPGVYRKGVVLGPIDMTNIRGRYCRFTLSFTCLPEQWLVEGERPTIVHAAGEARIFGVTMLNPTPFTAKPLIRLLGNGPCSLNVGKYIMDIANIDGHIDIDCDLGECYRNNAPCNDVVTINSRGFPSLPTGETEIVVAGQVTQTVQTMMIWPRWWTV